MSQRLLLLFTLLATALFLWISGVLLLTRQTALLLGLMLVAAALSVVLILYAKSRKYGILRFTGFLICALALGMACLSLWDILSPSSPV